MICMVGLEIMAHFQQIEKIKPWEISAASIERVLLSKQVRRSSKGDLKLEQKISEALQELRRKRRGSLKRQIIIRKYGLRGYLPASYEKLWRVLRNSPEKGGIPGLGQHIEKYKQLLHPNNLKELEIEALRDLRGSASAATSR